MQLKLISVILFLLYVIISWSYHTSTVTELEAKLKKAEMEFTALERKTTEQNSEIDRLSVIGAEYKRQMDLAASKNDIERKRLLGEISRLGKIQIPKDCDGAMNFLRGQSKETTSKW